MKKAMPIIGFIAFALGILMAVAFGIFPFNREVVNGVIIALVVLGLIVGFLNITTKEIIPLLVATIALIVVGNVFEPISAFGIGQIIDNVLKLIATLMAPAAVIAAIRTIVNVGFPKD